MRRTCRISAIILLSRARACLCADPFSAHAYFLRSWRHAYPRHRHGHYRERSEPCVSIRNEARAILPSGFDRKKRIAAIDHIGLTPIPGATTRCEPVEEDAR